MSERTTSLGSPTRPVYHLSAAAGEPPTIARRFDRWLLAPAPAERLAIFRILVGLFSLTYLLIRLPVFIDLADGRPSVFDPVGPLAWLESPLDPALVRLLFGLALVAAAGVTFGFLHRLSAPALAGSLLVLFTYRSSWSQLLHFENLLLLHAALLAFVPAADTLSIDSRLGRRARSTQPHTRYGWPLRLAALITAVTYVIAGVAKLRYGGWGWLEGDTLRNHVAYTAARFDIFGEPHSPVAGPFVRASWLFTPMAVAAVAVELAAPFALLGGRIRNIWVVAAIGMHATIAATMYIVFPYPLFGIAFVPLFASETALERLRVRR